MLKSMTGYGRTKTADSKWEITTEIRSVNHRYLDINIKSPRIYPFLEDAAKKAVSAAVQRGKVDLYISVKAKDGQDIVIKPNMPVISGYMEALKAISQNFGLENDISAYSLLRLPDALSADKEEADADELTQCVMEVLKKTLAEYNEMRTFEGEKLCADIKARAKTIAGFVEIIEARSPNSVEEYKARIAQRMEELIDSPEIAQSKIMAEAAIFADKVAVTEEIIRLKSHLSQLEKMLTSSDAIGRKIDFLIQELNREANTIGSKANDYDISKVVIDLKAEIEKIREQVQNLE